MGPTLWLWWAETDRQCSYEGMPSLPEKLCRHRGYLCTGKQVFLGVCLHRFFSEIYLLVFPKIPCNDLSSRSSQFYLQSGNLNKVTGYCWFYIIFLSQAIKMVYWHTTGYTNTLAHTYLLAFHILSAYLASHICVLLSKKDHLSILVLSPQVVAVKCVSMLQLSNLSAADMNSLGHESLFQFLKLIRCSNWSCKDEWFWILQLCFFISSHQPKETRHSQSKVSHWMG